ncbi:hypothetical protein Pcinc_018386 [Petrolisthes cinctipes]|uniref:Uncharacterized protein n=1 Tax=Petrolisthes cinctipes TaxID=88211 RepID=A0AAE1FNN9_PETCI|nr:hypothetical protein Pcinc_018386 [Petrolisthes cinctipes]
MVRNAGQGKVWTLTSERSEHQHCNNTYQTTLIVQRSEIQRRKKGPHEDLSKTSLKDYLSADRLLGECAKKGHVSRVCGWI